MDPDFVTADLARIDLGTFALAAAAAVVEPDVPAVPGADHCTILNDTFT